MGVMVVKPSHPFLARSRPLRLTLYNQQLTFRCRNTAQTLSAYGVPVSYTFNIRHKAVLPIEPSQRMPKVCQKRQTPPRGRASFFITRSSGPLCFFNVFCEFSRPKVCAVPFFEGSPAFTFN